jgi:signal transduction histidine kinase/DNA-binding NarL/FixJ family response regulator
MNNRILIVDDNPDIHADFRKVLCPPDSSSRIGQADEAFFGTRAQQKPAATYELTSAYQGLDAIEIVRQAAKNNTPFALAFVDVRMPPGIDGVQTIKGLWAIDPDLEVVISTAYSDYSWEELRAQLEQADWLLVLKKPFDTIEVVQLTKALTRKWRLERDGELQLASLQRSNAILKAQRETSIDGILVIDESHKVMGYNGRFLKLWGISQTVTATNDDNLLLASMASNLKDPLLFYERMKSRNENPTESSRDEVTLADGRVFDQYSTPIIGEQGQDYGHIWYYRDVTRERQFQDELRQARDAADQANRYKSAFLANMSHEIRTPMTAILGYADILAQKRRTISIEEHDEYIATIKRNGEHLLSIINDILDISKIESGKMSVERIPTCLAGVVQDVLGLLKVNAAAQGLNLQAVYETPIPMSFKCDPLRLKQILLNLIGNAVKFTKSGSVTVKVSLDDSRPDDVYLRIGVEDSGIGMTKEQVARLFKAFEQADASTTRNFGGTGLGLRISKRLAQLLGGDINVTSERGRGSVFTLTLPAGVMRNLEIMDQKTAAGFALESRVEPSETGSSTPLEGLRILLAEDGEDNQRLITYHLKDAGARVELVPNGEELVKRLTVDGTVGGPLRQDAPADLVLLDMLMPVMDGYTAVRMLRSKGSNLPIIALTARAMTGESDECLVAGCNAYTAKPIDQAGLISVCAKWGGQEPTKCSRTASRPCKRATSNAGGRGCEDRALAQRLRGQCQDGRAGRGLCVRFAHESSSFIPVSGFREACGTADHRAPALGLGRQLWV